MPKYSPCVCPSTEVYFETKLIFCILTRGSSELDRVLGRCRHFAQWPRSPPLADGRQRLTSTEGQLARVRCNACPLFHRRFLGSLVYMATSPRLLQSTPQPSSLELARPSFSSTHPLSPVHMATVAVSSWVPEQHLQARLGLPPARSGRALSRGISQPTSPNLGATSPISEAGQQRDPHRLPEFGSTTLTIPTAPILYLPPLLSSLPPGYSQPPQPASSFRPLTTDTRLPDIDPASLLLHKALHNFQPATPEYSVTPYEDAFNWKELVLPEDTEREWYCVVFRSKRKEGSDGGRKCHT